jgi:hypothetical protein
LFVAAPRIISWILGKMGIHLQTSDIEDEAIIDYTIDGHTLRIRHTTPGTIILGNKLELNVFYDGQKKIAEYFDLTIDEVMQRITSGQASFEFTVIEHQESVKYSVLLASIPTIELQEIPHLQVFRNGVPLEEYIAELGGAQ